MQTISYVDWTGKEYFRPFILKIDIEASEKKGRAGSGKILAPLQQTKGNSNL